MYDVSQLQQCEVGNSHPALANTRGPPAIHTTLSVSLSLLYKILCRTSTTQVLQCLLFYTEGLGFNVFSFQASLFFKCRTLCWGESRVLLNTTCSKIRSLCSCFLEKKNVNLHLKCPCFKFYFIFILFLFLFLFLFFIIFL